MGEERKCRQGVAARASVDVVSSVLLPPACGADGVPLCAFIASCFSVPSFQKTLRARDALALVPSSSCFPETNARRRSH